MSLRYFMCSPDHYGVEYVINPWMEGHVGEARGEAAREQWRALRRHLEQHASVEVLLGRAGVPDLVFTANAGLILGNKAVISRFRHPQRQREEAINRQWFAEHGFETVELPAGVYFEGAGDALLDREAPRLWMGYGFRSTLEAADHIARALDVDVVPLRQVDERFYHLDTCFCPLTGGKLIYYAPAFDERSRATIEELVPAENRFAVSEEDALHFACNAVDTGTHVILNDASPALEAVLKGWGFAVVRTPLSEFILAGGAAKCLTLRLTEPRRGPRATRGPVLAMRTLEFGGHLIDSGALGRIMDTVTAMGGVFEVRHFKPGVRASEETALSLAVTAPGEAAMRAIAAALADYGARVDEHEAGPVVLETVEKPGVAPERFYATNIFPTDAYHNGQWIRVQRQRMDGAIVIDESGEFPTATCRIIRDLEVGDRVVVGEQGVRVHYRREEDSGGEFKFMSSNVSSERRVETAVAEIAEEMRRIRARNGRIVVVAGPVVIHTGGGPYLANLAKAGYVQALLGGNAIAVHDIEHSMFGTSLGVDLKKGAPVHGGHRHHLYAINRVRRCGSIAAAVAQGVVASGLFKELVLAGVPYCLAGSIRDDGPLPDTLMDLIEAQREYARLLEGANMVLMLSSMLHSIGTGNMTPSGVRMVSVDINPAVATKLADRGSVDSVPVVTDVGLFLNLLERKLLG